MKRSFSATQFVPPFFLSVVLFWAYLVTMAPGLTWANGGSDGGDLITAVAVGGVPHPTGYPVYLILAKFFQSIPIGSLAYRTNILSAVCMTLASLVLYVLVRHYLTTLGKQHPQFAGLVAGFAFGLAPLVWSQAVITEVYALHALLIAILLYLYTRSSGQAPFIYRWRGLCFGLSLGNHITSILLLPILIADIFLDKALSTRQKWTFFLYQSLWAFAALTIYLVLPLRASSFPPVNWGNPQTLDGLKWLVTGQLYWGQLLPPASTFLPRVSAWVTLLLENLSLPGLYLGLMGMVYFFKRSRFYICTLWVVIVFSMFSIQYGTVDSSMYLIPVFICFSAWVGVGVDGLLNLLGQRSDLKIGLGAIMVSFLFINAIHIAPHVDASHDDRAEKFVAMVFAQAPEQAILFVEGDGAVFSLWYYHYALHERPDLFIVAPTLLHFPWYIETLQATYPALDLSEPFPWTQTVIETNPGRPYCYVSNVNVTQVECVYP